MRASKSEEMNLSSEIAERIIAMLEEGSTDPGEWERRMTRLERSRGAGVYVVLIFVRILMSWIPRMPYNRTLSALLQFVTDVTDPYLNLFRRFIPMIRVGPGALDLSPIIATFVLIIVGGAIAALIRG